MDTFKYKYAGIDGCKAGWVYVGIDEKGQYDLGVNNTFRGAIEGLQGAHLILVDMPIGLPSAGRPKQACDIAARKVLSPRGSSVFPVPARSALARPTYQESSAENQRVLGKKLSTQSWAIVPKIREVDELIREQRFECNIREMHPEVAFWALNDEKTLGAKKKSAEGEKERLQILGLHYPKAIECYEAGMKLYKRNDVGRDDILDALVGAVTAMHAPNIGTLPPIPSVDELGLPMEMVYSRFGAAPADKQHIWYHELEAQAAETLGRIIFAFTRFEFNLALALRFANSNRGNEPFELWQDKLNLNGKLSKLLKIAERQLQEEPRLLAEFKAWNDSADLLRRKRNAYVHGRWGISPGKQRIINVSADNPCAGENGETYYSLGELKRELDDIERIEAEFHKIRVNNHSFSDTKKNG